jgi:uncharacterized membrane protein YhaH (DUF805 family)
MDARVQLVFFGEVLSGFHLDDVKRNLGQLLKLDETRLTQLFTGARTVLKRSLEPHEAERYASHLATFGARIHIEPYEPRPPAAAVTPPLPVAVAASSAPALSVAPPAEEEIVCPTCGERQSRRILCRSCATDMPMGIAAKLEADREARAARMAETRARHGLAPLHGDRSTPAEDAPPIWGLAFSGRMARLPYATGSTLLLTVLFLLAVFAMQRPSTARMTVLVLGFVLVLFLSVRVTVLRCHDCNRSGWWSLIMVVPYVGAAASLALCLMPGSRDDNDHGGRPREGRWLFLLLALVAMGVSIGLTFRTVMSLVERGMGSPSSLKQSSEAGDPAQHLPAEAARAFRSDYAAAPAHKAFALSPGGAWGWWGGVSSMEEAVQNAVARCEANRKPYTPSCEVVNVDGQWASSTDE